MSMTAIHTHPVKLVGGGPGAWDLITVRGMNALQGADIIFADHLGPTAELGRLCDIDSKELVDVSKLPYKKHTAQSRINDMLIDAARAGKKVARLKGGDPYVFGRGFEEYQVLTQAGLVCEVIPGVSSPVAVPAVAGVPITQRGLVHSFTVVSGHLAPGDERSLVNWEALAKSGGTIAVIMGVRQAGKIGEALIRGGLDASTPVAIIQEGTLDGERRMRCVLGELGDKMVAAQVEPPAVYVIGAVAGL